MAAGTEAVAADCCTSAQSPGAAPVAPEAAAVAPAAPAATPVDAATAALLASCCNCMRWRWAAAASWAIPGPGGECGG